MALDAAGWQRKICKELGRWDKYDPITDQTVRHPDQEEFLADVESLWDEYADKGGRLRYLYTKRHACELLQGRAWEGVDFTDDDVTEKVNQESQNLQQLYDNTTKEINRIEARRMQATGSTVGKIAATVEHPLIAGYRNPNDRAYKGHPLFRVPSQSTGSGVPVTPAGTVVPDPSNNWTPN